MELSVDFDFAIPAAAFALTSGALSAWLWHRGGFAGTASASVKPYLMVMTAGVAVSIISWLVFHFFWPRLYPRVEGQENAPWWVGLSYFGAMLVGMAAHTAFYSIRSRRRGRAPVFDPWAFVEPALVAPIIFLAVRGFIPDEQFTFEALLFSFQNGFFWQTVWGEMRRR
jgi:uncharacterized membrane protein